MGGKTSFLRLETKSTKTLWSVGSYYDSNKPIDSNSNIHKSTYSFLLYRCLETEQLFVDPMFPPCESSLYVSKSSPEIKWIRASELVEDPQFFVGGGTRFDINQGELGDCWLLAAIASLTLHQKLFKKVVPHDQGNLSRGICDNYVPQCWVEFDDESSWLFTKRFRAFYLLCRK